MSETKQLCTFYLNNFSFGIEVHRIQEVIRFQKITKVSLAPPVLKGLINLRGQIVTAIDLRERMKLPSRPQEQLPMNVIVRTDDGLLSFLVDQIGDVLEVEDDLLESPPETLEQSTRDLIVGAYKLKERLLLLLNINKIVSLDGSEKVENEELN